jgi:hypothetical protein
MTTPFGVEPLFPDEIEAILVDDYEHAVERLRWVMTERLINAISTRVDRHGVFPINTNDATGIPEVLISPQVRKLDQGGYLVASCRLYDGPRLYSSVYLAVAAFVRSEFRTR